MLRSQKGCNAPFGTGAGVSGSNLDHPMYCKGTWLNYCEVLQGITSLIEAVNVLALQMIEKEDQTSFNVFQSDISKPAANQLNIHVCFLISSFLYWLFFTPFSFDCTVHTKNINKKTVFHLLRKRTFKKCIFLDHQKSWTTNWELS